MSHDRTYQLLIRVPRATHLRVGSLGEFDFAPGFYVYTGSAQRGLEARIARHLSDTKRLRWHIDYLLATPDVRVLEVWRFAKPECEVCQRTAGTIPILGFGASDCLMGCGSHLKRLDA